MKYAFIVNPASGQGKHGEHLIPDLEDMIKDNPDRDIKVYYTCGERDAIVLADSIAAEYDGVTDDEGVIVACGGDGTVQEVANGIYGHDNAILGIVPAGSGNDYVRELSKNKGNTADYNKVSHQLDGMPRHVDLLRLSWIENGEEKSRLVINGVNIGFDGNTAILAHELKRLPGVSGMGSYALAVLYNLAGKKGQRLRITADGKAFHTGDLLLVTAAKGGFCGAGVQSCPRADLSSGLIELMAIKDISRRRFIALFPRYKRGRIFDTRGIDDIISYTQAKNIIIEPMLGQTMKFVGDGETFETGVLHIDIVPRAIRVWML